MSLTIQRKLNGDIECLYRHRVVMGGIQETTITIEGSYETQSVDLSSLGHSTVHNDIVSAINNTSLTVAFPRPPEPSDDDTENQSNFKQFAVNMKETLDPRSPWDRSP